MNYLISIDAAGLDVIAAALGKLPFEQVANLFANLKMQVAAQEAQAKAQAVDEPEIKPPVVPYVAVAEDPNLLNSNWPVG